MVYLNVPWPRYKAAFTTCLYILNTRPKSIVGLYFAHMMKTAIRSLIIHPTAIRLSQFVTLATI